jgi:tetratricopeptide (TPR) repeat protein
MRRFIPVFLAVLLVLCVLGFAQDPPALIAQANQQYDRFGKAFDLAAYESDLRQAIALWQQAATLLPAGAVQTKTQVLSHIAQASFELAEGYLTTTKEQEAAYAQGKDAALAALQLDASFTATKDKDGFRAALEATDDAVAVFWYGNDLGRWLNFHALTAITGGMKDVAASFKRALSLDETYLGGGPHRSLACFLAQVPSVLGGNLEEAKSHFEQAIAIDPDFIENYVDYAAYYAKPKKDWTLFTTLLDEAVARAKDPDAFGKWPFYNTLAVDRAKALRQDVPQ